MRVAFVKLQDPHFQIQYLVGSWTIASTSWLINITCLIDTSTSRQAEIASGSTHKAYQVKENIEIIEDLEQHEKEKSGEEYSTDNVEEKDCDFESDEEYNTDSIEEKGYDVESEEEYSTDSIEELDEEQDDDSDEMEDESTVVDESHPFFKGFHGEYGPYFQNFTSTMLFTWISKHMICECTIFF